MPEYSESETVTLTRQDQGEIPYSGNSEKMTDHPLVTVVVVNYNGRHFLRECLASITDQTYAPLEVILVDNASSDGSVEFVRALFPGIHIVQNNENRGFSGGVNSGIRESNGTYIITLNNDTRMDSHCIRHLVHAMSGDARIGMGVIKMLFPDGTINSTGICISRSGAAWDRDMFKRDSPDNSPGGEIVGPCAGAAMYRRSMLDAIGLFDEDFFLFMEDVDLALRARLAGWECAYVPQAVVYHHHGGTAGFMSDLTVYYGNRNILWYPVKDFPAGYLVTSIPWIMGRTIAVIPYYALRGQGRVILKSKIDGLKGIPDMIRKRRTVKRIITPGIVKKIIRTWSSVQRRSDVDH